MNYKYKLLKEVHNGGPIIRGIAIDRTGQRAFIIHGDNHPSVKHLKVQVVELTIPDDIDNDGLPNHIEEISCTFADDIDSDDDGIIDGIEDKNHNGVIDLDETNPCDDDTDSDGLSDGVEDTNHNGIVDSGETNPLNTDTDKDGMPDGWEYQNDLYLTINDANEDEDGDGFSNLKEYLKNTDPGDYNSHPPRSMPWLPLLLED